VAGLLLYAQSNDLLVPPAALRSLLELIVEPVADEGKVVPMESRS
jgi:hypothetical protein